MHRRFGRAVAGLTLFACATAHAGTVFINEFHYDNAGTDTGEFIEIAAPAGTDASQYKLYLYNGNGGATYANFTLPASAGASGHCGTYDVYSIATPGLQNGPNDGIALVQGTTVIQFLSYAGTLTATNGPAIGMTSVDVGVAESATATPVGSSLRLTGTGTQYSDFTWNAPAAATPGACNAGQTFGTPPDVPPTVGSTTPANNATGVAVGATVGVVFSENVTLDANPLSLSCATSGAHTLAQSGSGASYVFTPSPAFANSEVCTATVLAANVHDVDGTIDAMGADYTFQFTTAAVVVDVPPTVNSTSPADNAANVATTAGATVSFSEAVTLDANALTISCGTSGTHVATTSGSGATYSFAVTPAYAALESCTATVVATRVHDLDGTPDTMAADYVFHFSTLGSSGDYYASVDASTPATLRASLHALIKSHRFFPYTAGTTDVWDILKQADQYIGDPGKVLDVYQNRQYANTAQQGGGQTPRGDYFEREHSWPNSWGFNDAVNAYPYTDTHALFVANGAYNGARNDNVYGNCNNTGTEYATQTNSGAGGAGDSNWLCTAPANSGASSQMWQTWSGKRGDVARAAFYMDVRYEGGTEPKYDANGTLLGNFAEPDLVLTDDLNLIVNTPSNVVASVGYGGLKSVLLAWAVADPVDDVERLRNEVVYSYQLNRNPFVDHPEWIACLYQGVCNAPVDQIFKNGFE